MILASETMMPALEHENHNASKAERSNLEGLAGFAD
jgi:hypothetical protein